MDLPTALSQFDVDEIFLDVATYGPGPRAAHAALRRAVDGWYDGTAVPAAWDREIERCRALFGELVGVHADEVAVGSQSSQFIALVAHQVATAEPGSEVLVTSGEFASVIYPFLAAGCTVREVEFDELAGAVRPETALVAVAAVQSRDGRIVDLPGLRAAVDAVGARLLVDVTQAAGWWPVDARVADFCVASGYKWLMAPRGTCFFTGRPEALATLTPHAAGWWAGQDRWIDLYGTPMVLAETARRFDVSPAWHSWVGAEPALELLLDVGVETVHAHDLAMNHAFCEEADLEPSDSAILALRADADVPRIVAEHAIRTSMRSGRMRLAFHLCVDEERARHAGRMLRGHVTR